MSAPPSTRDPSLTLTHFQGLALDTPIDIFLPDTLAASQLNLLLPDDISSDPAFTFPALQHWLSRSLKNLARQQNARHPHHKIPYSLRAIDIQAVDWFTKTKLGFMKIQAKLETDPYVHEGEKEAKVDWLPGAVFLRGGSVAMLIVVQPSDAVGENEKQVIFTVQPRIAAGSLAFIEIPAGMLDGNSFRGAAAAELKEEAGLEVKEDDLINMCELASDSSDESSSETIETAMYPSVGACDEFIPLFLCQKRLTRRHMQWLKGKATGLRNEGEKITLKLVPLSRAWREGARDAKALAALALYEGLKGEGKIPDMPPEVEAEPADLKTGSDKHEMEPEETVMPCKRRRRRESRELEIEAEEVD
ncbi:hypothetical protein CC86DRAFT_472187 [Ophiobolus disseminans]|uniref:Uncharacterized protein n=1 Tax=Ophiobolus disseminans TaxID=1469910 RepID=A0A6A6ZE34_9PLEO|nr:hypothetical protein CC86DRAFT_472187 [Ophiobolus disseminans]